MELREFFDKAKTSPTAWAKKYGIPQPVISRFLTGKRGISLSNAAKIVKATGGIVGFEDLVKPGNGDTQKAQNGG